jgi:two-component system, LytTR family, sensor kinase
MSTAETQPFLDESSSWRKWGYCYAVSFAVWTFLWVLLNAAYLGRAEKAQTWRDGLGVLSDFWVSALLTPLFLFLAWRCPLDRVRWRRCLPRLLAAMAVFAALDDALCQMNRLALERVVGEMWLYPFWGQLWGQRSLSVYLHTIFNYMQITAVGWAVHYQREARMRAVRTSRLEASLAEARLAMLRMQLQPHFLFNTLNSIAALMRRDVDAADRMIARLAELLRHSLDTTGRREVTLREELETLARYLEIEQTRFADRLTVQYEVEPETLDALVPGLILQPIVENAVRHGVAQRPSAGLVALAARRDDGQLVIAVSDDGPGLAASHGAATPGIGLANTRARLEQLYGLQHGLDIYDRPDGGTDVVLRLPYHTVAPEALEGEASEGDRD